MRSFAVLLLVAAFTPSACISSVFYDDFSDTDISDWEERCIPCSWWASAGAVHGSTGGTCSVLVPPGDINMWNCTVSISGYGTHTLGVVARLNSEDTGIYAYVSPDHNVARIRRVNHYGTSTIYSSINGDFPSGEIYELTLTCEDELLQLDISVPATSQFWSFTAIDPFPRSGQFGLAIGDEPHAYWDWISVDGLTGIEEEAFLPVEGPDLRIWPNPSYDSFNFSVSGVGDGPRGVDIYDSTGRLVASREIVVERGYGSVAWDGRFGDGSTVPAGVYLARIHGCDLSARTLVRLE